MNAHMQKQDALRLMIPGPTEVSPKALERMAQPIRPHYGDDWTRLYFDTVEKLKKVFQTKNDLFILAATSSAAMEMAVSHAVEPKETILICKNGSFGERFEEMARSLGCNVLTTVSKYGRPVTAQQVRDALEKNPRIKAMAMVHNETSVAVESNLSEVLGAAREYGVLTIVDTVSSMGGVDIQTDRLGIDFCVSGSQKCLGAPAGLAFISVSGRAWEAIENRREPVRAWYLNLNILKKYRDQWIGWHPQGPNTASVPLYLALNCVLGEILDEGLENRFRRHICASKAFRDSIRAMGLGLFVEDAFASKTVTAVCVPEGVDGAALRENMEKKHHILVAGGMGAFSKSMIRVSHMSMTASMEYLAPTLWALEEELLLLKAGINRGAATDVLKQGFEKYI